MPRFDEHNAVGFSRFFFILYCPLNHETNAQKGHSLASHVVEVDDLMFDIYAPMKIYRLFFASEMHLTRPLQRKTTTMNAPTINLAHSLDRSGTS
jgi:hypothetical protein